MQAAHDNVATTPGRNEQATATHAEQYHEKPAWHAEVHN